MFTMRDSEPLSSGLDISLLEVDNLDMKPSAAFDPMNEFHGTLEDRNVQTGLSFDDALRDSLAQEYRVEYPHEMKEDFTNEVPMECTSEDIAPMTFSPVEDGRAVDMFGSDEPFFGLNDPQETVTRFGGHQQQSEVVSTYNTPVANYDDAAPSNYPTDETQRYDEFLSFQEINETNVKLETVQEFRAPVAVAPTITRSAPVPTTTPTRTVSPSLQQRIPEDYSAEWAQPRGSGDFDFFAETIQQPNGVKSVSVPNLGLLDQHCVIKTQLGLAVLLNCESSNPGAGNLPRSVKQPTSSNVLGAHQQSNLFTTSNRKFQRWSPEEDDLLKQAVEIEGKGRTINWKRISSKFFDNARTSLQCKSRWTKSLKPGINRGAWTPEEDECILKYKQQGMKFSEMAKFMPGRLPEHISDRFGNALDPTLKKTAWTREEDLILFQEQRRLGNKWTQISQLIPGRSENSVKNRWHNLKVTRQRKLRNQAKEFQREAALRTQETTNGQQEPSLLFPLAPPTNDSTADIGDTSTIVPFQV